MNRFDQLKLIALTTAASGLVACGPPEGEKTDEPLDHATVQQAVTDNTSTAAARLSAAIAFLDGAPVLDSTLAAGGGTTVCEPLPDGAPEGAEPTCYEEETDVQIDFDLSDEGDALTTQIEARILTDENVESSTDTEITYLLKGSVVCAQDGAAPDPECVTQVDDSEIRLRVTSPADGDIDIAVLVGPDKASPLLLELHDDLIAAEVDLGEVDAAAAHLESVVGESIELPQTFQGRARVELALLGPEQVEGSLSILQTIKIADGDFTVSAATADPLARAKIDGAAKTLESEVAAGAIDAQFPAYNYTYDDTTGTEIETRYDFGFHLAGLTGTSTLTESLDSIVMTGLGLGPDTATASIDGEQVIAVDLNPDDGRTLDATLTAGPNDSLEIEVSPKLDLTVMLQMAAAANVLSDIDDWMLDEVLRITLDGSTAPKVRLAGDQLEVIEGTLTVSMENADVSRTATAGQCMLQDDAPTTTGGTEPTTASNPLTNVTAGTCQ